MMVRVGLTTKTDLIPPIPEQNVEQSRVDMLTPGLGGGAASCCAS